MGQFVGLAASARAGRVMLVAVVVVVGLAGSLLGASAQAGPETIAVCQNRYTGQLRIPPANQACTAGEVRLEFQTAAGAAAQQDEINDVEARVAALEARMDTAEGDIDALEDRASLLEDRATLLEDRATNLEGRMDTAEDDIDALEGRMDTAEGDIDTAESDIDALEGRMDTAEGDIDDLEGRMNTAEGDIDSLEGRMSTAEGNITALDTRVTNIRDFFTGVANDIIGCFTADGADFSFTIPAINFPRIAIPIGDLGEIVITEGFQLVPAIPIGIPLFDATYVVSCLNGISTATTQ